MKPETVLRAFAERTRVTKQVTALKTSVEQPLLRAMSDAYQGAYGTAPAARRDRVICSPCTQPRSTA